MSQKVATTVRAPRPLRDNQRGSNEGKAVAQPTGRALILALNEGDQTASLLFEDPAPQPFPLSPTAGGRKRRLNKSFLLVPHFGLRKDVNSVEDNAEEEDVPVSSLTKLLSFESGDSSPQSDAQSAKEHADALLRLQDFSSAASFYEEALSLTSVLSIGSAIVLNRSGRAVVADVDCIDEEEGMGGRCSIDVTYLSLDAADSEEEEGTVLEKEVLLCLSSDSGNDKSPSLQERILLNLSRCLLRLAEIDVAGKRAMHRPAEYRRAAVLGCTLALTSASFRTLGWGGPTSSPATGSTTEEKALILRAAAFSDLPGKSKNAQADLRRSLKINPGCAQAKRMSRDLNFRDARRKRTDKKLSKEVCRWVQRATDAAEGRGAGT
uniref:Tetratricopeptide repeat-containing protein n=1 Tax=Odontella aurita TaxID=265563 RepID=A0A7S4M917_9STRA|mmetsp:Transcript_14504/g.42496  ORF Transcript_14504/g.42496 Transcript_14504/m.42496 type:complete len:379 (+) Transcript_14504:216-1352(+)